MSPIALPAVPYGRSTVVSADSVVPCRRLEHRGVVNEDPVVGLHDDRVFFRVACKAAKMPGGVETTQVLCSCICASSRNRDSIHGVLQIYLCLSFLFGCAITRVAVHVLDACGAAAWHVSTTEITDER